MKISKNSDASSSTFQTLEFYENTTAFAIRASSSCYNVSNFFGFKASSFTVFAWCTSVTQFCPVPETFWTNHLLINIHLIDDSFCSFFKSYCEDNVFCLFFPKIRIKNTEYLFTLVVRQQAEFYMNLSCNVVPFFFQRTFLSSFHTFIFYKLCRCLRLFWIKTSTT